MSRSQVILPGQSILTPHTSTGGFCLSSIFNPRRQLALLVWSGVPGGPAGGSSSDESIAWPGVDPSVYRAGLWSLAMSLILETVPHSSGLTGASLHLVSPSLVLRGHLLLARIHCKPLHESWRHRLFLHLSDSLPLLHLVLGLSSSSSSRGRRCLGCLVRTVSVNTLHVVKQIVCSRESIVRA